jgi:hypothetical protein
VQSKPGAVPSAVDCQVEPDNGDVTLLFTLDPALHGPDVRIPVTLSAYSAKRLLMALEDRLAKLAPGSATQARL